MGRATRTVLAVRFAAARCNTSRFMSTRSTTCSGCAIAFVRVVSRWSARSITASFKSIYFDGPEGLNLEICCGTNIDGEAWIDPEVVGLCGITEAELEALKEPAGFERPAHPVPQPSTPHATSVQDDEQPAWYSRVIALTDDEVWERMSEPTPPVRTED